MKNNINYNFTSGEWGALGLAMSIVVVAFLFWAINTRMPDSSVTTNIATSTPQEKKITISTTTTEKEQIVDNALYGVASYYDYVLESGWSSVGHYVCATRDFERYSKVLVTNLDNGKFVVARVTDYGPDASIFPERIVDLSSTAFRAIGNTKLGILKNVKVEYYEKK